MTSDDIWLVAVSAGAWQVAGIRAARRAGLRVLALDGSADAAGLKEADRAVIVDIRNVKAVVDAVRQEGASPAGAVSFVSEVGMRGAAAVRDAFGLPGPGLATINSLVNKGAQRAAWQAADLPIPRWSVLKRSEPITPILEFDSTPLIVKPVDAAGGRGITVVHPGGNLEAAIHYAFGYSKSQEAIVETFIPGQEYTVETMSYNGHLHLLVVTEKHKFPDMNDTVSSEILTLPADSPVVARIASLAAQAYSALDYRDGPGHMEIIRDGADKLWLVEAAGRAGGVMISEGLVPWATGFDQQHATAMTAVGLPPKIPRNLPVKDTILRWLLGRVGVFSHMNGLDAANAIGGVHCGPLVPSGTVVSRANNDDDRIGFILASGDSRAEAISLADKAESLVSFTFREEK